MNDSDNNIYNAVRLIAKRAKSAFATSIDSQTKTNILHQTAGICGNNIDNILFNNARDMQTAKNNNRSDAYLDRLYLDQGRIIKLQQTLHDIAEQPDPIGEVLQEWDRPNGLHIKKIRVPLGVVGIIYESRPNVTLDAAALCLKSGNTSVLKCGSDSLNSSRALLDCLHIALAKYDLTTDLSLLIPFHERPAVTYMLQQSDFIDIIIPRGGKGLIQEITQHAKMPVIKHLDGICHIYIDKDASLQTAIAVTLNSKMRRTGVCGAVETILIHHDVLTTIGVPVLQFLYDAGCEIRGDSTITSTFTAAIPADDSDWDTEYLNAIVSVAVVDNIAGAINHIANHSSHHTDCIITENINTATTFQKQVDSAIVMHNTSTQFADGGEFGFGAEIGISTDRFHVRGPVGAEHLTTTSYHVTSNADFSIRAG